ncbi:MAG: hypothetical protein AAGI70_10735, partial [Pseudomonadota bacterium]
PDLAAGRADCMGGARDANLRIEADGKTHVAGSWAMGTGPALTMEFTRVSPKRKMGLAVCLDPEVGVPCPTHAIRSTRGEIGTARADLARRERTELGNIGAFCREAGMAEGSLPEVISAVASWCQRTGRQGAVWTDIGPNFAAQTGAPFTVARGAAYLRGLTGESLDEAVGYIHRAPAATDTPLRRALAREAWWQAEVERLKL